MSLTTAVLLIARDFGRLFADAEARGDRRAMDEAYALARRDIYEACRAVLAGQDARIASLTELLTDIRQTTVKPPIYLCVPGEKP